MEAREDWSPDEPKIEPIDFVIAAFNDEAQAGEVLEKLKQLERKAVIAILNAAVMVKRSDGKVTVKETQDVDSMRGAIFGAITGGLIGLLGGPAGAIVGAAAGAATGGVAANRIDMGFPDQTLKELQETLTPGSSAILALIKHAWVDRIIAELEKYDAKLFRQALKAEIAAQLAAKE